jgi:hypothetical protein
MIRGKEKMKKGEIGRIEDRANTSRSISLPETEYQDSGFRGSKFLRAANESKNSFTFESCVQ